MIHNNLLQTVACLKSGQITVSSGNNFVNIQFSSRNPSYLGRMWNAFVSSECCSELTLILPKIEEAFAKFIEHCANLENQQLDNAHVCDFKGFIIYESESTCRDNYQETLKTLKDETAIIHMFIRDNSASPEIGIRYHDGEEKTASLCVNRLQLGDLKMDIEVFSDVDRFCRNLGVHEKQLLMMQFFPEEVKNLLGNNQELIHITLVLMTQGAELPTYLLLQSLFRDEEDVNVFSKSGRSPRQRSHFEVQANGEVLLKIYRVYELKNISKIQGVIKTFTTETIFNLSCLDKKIQVSVLESSSPEGILEGMRKMKLTLKDVDNFEAAEFINKTIYRMDRCYRLTRSLLESHLTSTSIKKLCHLESSMIFDAWEEESAISDSLTYLQLKLELFLLLREHKLTPYQIEIVRALIEEVEDGLCNQLQKHSFFLREQDCLNLKEMMQRKLLRLDHLKGVAAKVGVCCPSGFHFSDLQAFIADSHPAPISCRKEGNDHYVINTYNASLAEFGKVSEQDDQWGKTVREFMPVQREIALDCLTKTSTAYYFTQTIKDYQCAFEPLTPREIPGLANRPFQRIGNYAIRNYMEWIIYTLQRLNESELANEIMFFQVIQNESTYIKSPIQSLDRREDEDFFLI